MNNYLNKVFKNYNQTGFTFVELLLYIAILTLMLTTLIQFAWNIIGGGAKSSVSQEVYSQARLISERIKYEIRNSMGISAVSANSISLCEDATCTVGNLTIISLSGTNLTIKQGAAAAVPLNSTQVAVSGLSFTNLTSGTSRNIRFVFTLGDNFTSGRQEYNASITIDGAAEVRNRTI